MKHIPVFASVLLFCTASLYSQATISAAPEIGTSWPGIHYQILQVDRIQDNRLIFYIKLLATNVTPEEGVFIGSKPSIPANATQLDVDMGLFAAKPFAIAGAEMIDEATQKKYSVLSPVAPPGKTYPPSHLLVKLSRGQSEMVSIQFAAPPPLPLDAQGRQPVQTISLLLPKANGALSRIPIPLPSQPN